MTQVGEGKNAAIRRIMRDRAATQKRTGVVVHRDASLQADPVPTPSDHSSNSKNSSNSENDQVPRVVTFEDDIMVSASPSPSPSPPYEPSSSPPSTDENYDHDDSLTSSHWALMEYDVVGDVQGHHHNHHENIHYAVTSPWNQDKAEGLVLQLLDSSLATLSPSSTETDTETKVNQVARDIRITSDVEPNVSWSTADGSSDTDDDQNANAPISHGLIPPLPATPGLAVSPQNDKHDDDIDDDKDDDDAAAWEKPATAPDTHRSPFQTFRFNSTSIALDETELYVRKIQQLEQQLAETRHELLLERQLRKQKSSEPMSSSSFPPDNEKNPTVATHLRTPASIPQPRTISRRRSFSASGTPTTPWSTASSIQTTTAEKLWERNSTLVTEIRFADQTCMELSHHNSALQEQLEVVQAKCHQLELTNSQLRSDHEASKAKAVAAETEIVVLRQQLVELRLESTTSTAEHRMEHILPENQELMQELQHSRQEIVSLRQEMVQNLEAYQNETCNLNDQINQLVLELKQSSEQNPIHDNELVKENEKLRRDIAERDATAVIERDRTREVIRRAMNAMNVQYETLQSTIYRKCDTFDHRMDALRSTVQYMEEAIVQYDEEEEDDIIELDSPIDGHSVDTNDENDGIIVPTRLEGGTLLPSDLPERADCVNATFTVSDDPQRHDETMDLAMMEEARTDLVNGSIVDLDGGDESPVPKQHDTPNQQQRYRITEHALPLFEPDVTFSPGEKSDTSSNNNSNFMLHHMLFLASTTKTAVKHSPSEISNDTSASLIEHNEVVTSRFHRGFKNLSTNLSYSESVDPSAHHERTCEMATQECTTTRDHFHTLRHTNEVVSSMLDESLEHLSKLNEIVIEHEHSLRRKEESLTMEKLVVETELEMIGKTIEVANQSLDTSIGQLAPNTKQPLHHLSALEEDKNMLTEQLTLKSRELENASKQIIILQDEAIKREKLMMRYERLRSEMEEADKLLRTKCIVPRGTSAETNKLVEDLYDKIDKFRDELRLSTQKVETLTIKFETIEAEKAEQIEKLDMNLKASVEENIALRDEIAKLSRIQEDLLVDRESQHRVICDKDHEIEKLQGIIDRLEHQIEGLEMDAVELRDELQRNNEKHAATLGRLDELQNERNSLKEHLASMTETQTKLEEKNQCMERNLLETDGALVDATEMRTVAEARAIDLAEELKHVLSELQLARETNEMYSHSLRQAAEFRSTMNHQAEELKTQLLTCHNRIASLEHELLSSNTLLTTSDAEIARLHHTNDNLVAKCSKLRDYVRKITKKCHDWETYHHRQSAALVQAFHQSCRKASELSMICMEKDQVRSLPMNDHCC